MKKLLGRVVAGASLAVVVAGVPVAVHAATLNLKQQINAASSPGTYISNDCTHAATDNGTGYTYAMSPKNTANVKQTSTGRIGGDGTSNCIVVDNAGSSAVSWTLAYAPSGAGEWTDGAKKYPAKGANDDAGQLTVNAAGGQLVKLSGNDTGVSKGTSATFSPTVQSATLMSWTGTAGQFFKGKLHSVPVSQTIPASTPTGSYTLNGTTTLTSA